MTLRRFALALFVILAAAVGASAQSSSVSATITDSGGVVWANGTYSLTLVTPQGATWSGGAITSPYTGSLSSSGAFTASVPDVNTISPGPSTYTLQVCPRSGIQQSCGTLTGVNITGATPTITFTPPALSIPGTSSLPVSAYADAEIAAPVPLGFIYYQPITAITGQYRECEAVTGNACTTWGNVAGSGGGTITGSGTPGYLPEFATATSIQNSPCDDGVTTTGTVTCAPSVGFTVTNPGTFSNTASAYPVQALVNSCNPQTLFQDVQYTAFMVSALTGCANGPTNNPGSAYNQTSGVSGFATAPGIGTGSGASRAVGVNGYGIITGNNTQDYGGNFISQDFNDSATGQAMVGAEFDIQPQKAASAYSGGGTGVQGIHIALYNQGGGGGIFGPAINFTANSFGTAAYFENILNVNLGILSSASEVINVNALGTATSGANYNCPILETAYANYWNGTAAANERFQTQCLVSSGTNPTIFQYNYQVVGAPSGQSTYLSLGSTSKATNLAFVHSDGSLGEVLETTTTGTFARTLPPSGGTFPIFSSAPSTVSCVPNVTSVTTYNLGCSEIVDAGAGVVVGSATGGAQGAGTLNATGLYINGVAVGSGSSAWSALTSGTNTSFAAVNGSGSSLTYSGTGTINASSLEGSVIGTSGGTIPLLNTANTFSATQSFGAALFTSTLAGVAITTAYTIQGGQDSTSSTPGGLTIRGGNNSGSADTAGDVTLEAGAATFSSGNGTQGRLHWRQTYTVAAALSSTFQVVSMTTTADQVQAAPLGSTTNIGIAQTVGGVTTQIYVETTGKTTVRFDGTPVIGDIACGPPTATGTIGLAHDNGTTACTIGQSLGIVTGQVSGTGSGATATVQLQI